MKNLKSRELFEKDNDFAKDFAEDKKDRSQELVTGYSDCCDAPVKGDSDICSKCKEHCEVVQHTNEGMMSEIDIIGQQAETRAEFITDLKDFLKQHAADKKIADDKDSLDQMANVYFDEKTGEKRENPNEE